MNPRSARPSTEANPMRHRHELDDDTCITIIVEHLHLTLNTARQSDVHHIAITLEPTTMSDLAFTAAGYTATAVALDAAGQPAHPTAAIVWTSDNTGVVTVEADPADPTGARALVTTVAPGSATITAAVDGIAGTDVLNITTDVASITVTVG